MFVTLPTFEQPLPAPWQEGGCRTWRAVELSARLPWFIVTLWTAAGARRIATDLLLSWERDVLQVISQSGEDISAIHYVEPPGQNDDGVWRLRQVRRAWLAKQDGQAGNGLVVFEDAGGEFCDPLHGVAPSQLVNRTLIHERI